MKRLLCCLIAVSVLCALDITVHSQQTSNTRSQTTATRRPEALVHSLYTKVVALHPLGISINMDAFAPYLSSGLVHRIDEANACLDDWYRQNPDPNSKPPGLEDGLFTGDDLRAEPQSFHIERAQAEKDGSVSVYVKLTHDEPRESPWTWHVAALVMRENGHFVMNDVIWLKDSPQDVDVRLSEYLRQGCDGTRWVGHSGKR
jgi:hypothetical protein